MTRKETQQFQDGVAATALAASAGQAFLLAGGKALQAHGLSRRPTEDVDLFTNNVDIENFARGHATIVQALREAGYIVEEQRKQPGFSRLSVTDSSRSLTIELELGIDWRLDHEGDSVAVGRALSSRDAVINKALAVFGRGYARDFIDLYNILESGAYTIDEIVQHAPQHDPGFDVAYFADSLRSAGRFPAAAVKQYDLSASDWSEIVDRMAQLADYIDRTKVAPAPESLSVQERLRMQKGRLDAPVDETQEQHAQPAQQEGLDL